LPFVCIDKEKTRTVKKVSGSPVLIEGIKTMPVQVVLSNNLPVSAVVNLVVAFEQIGGDKKDMFGPTKIVVPGLMSSFKENQKVTAGTAVIDVGINTEDIKAGEKYKLSIFITGPVGFIILDSYTEEYDVVAPTSPTASETYEKLKCITNCRGPLYALNREWCDKHCGGQQ